MPAVTGTAQLSATLAGHPFDVFARLVRAPDSSSPAAKIPQGFVIARNPGPGTA